MGTAVSIRTSSRNSMIDDLSADLDNGFVEIFAGTMPTDVETALSGNTLLARYTLSADAVAAASGGSGSFNTITQSPATNYATGTASFFRMYDSASPQDAVIQGTVGTSGEAMTVTTVSFTEGGAVAITNVSIAIDNP